MINQLKTEASSIHVHSLLIAFPDMSHTGEKGHNILLITTLAVGVLIALAVVFTSSENSIYSSVELDTFTLADIELDISHDVSAPLFLQNIDNSNLISKFLQKYNLDQASQFSLDSTTYSSASEVGWAYIDVYGDDSCEGTLYGVGGVVAGVCLPIYADNGAGNSLMIDCSNGRLLLFTQLWYLL